MHISINQILFSFFLIIVINTTATAYQCEKRNSDDAASASEKFDVDDDGTVTDIDSGLTWMRCALGQTWDGSTCNGQPASYSWQLASKATHQLNKKGGFASFTDWRIPKLMELASIADINCQDPRIDLSLFPKTPAAMFWTSDKKKGTENSIYTLSFGNDGVNTRTTHDLNYVRLVRGRD